jgi:DNA (cytosine-5)-methyltransferase 1
MKTKKLTVGGLCSGVGGIEKGFQSAGFKVSWANDMDKYAMNTYEKIMKKNHYIGKEAMTIESILSKPTLLNQLTTVDVLVSGFPCQAFSVAGYRKGFDDERGNVFFKIRDIIKYLGKKAFPKALLLENVKNFKTHDNEETYKEVRRQLNRLGYSVYTKILNTADYTSIPQNRERTFMVCFYGEKKWKEYQLDEEPNFKENINAKKDCPLTYDYHESFNRLKKKKLKLISNFLDNINNIPEKYFYDDRFKITKQLKKDMTDTRTFYQWRRVYTRPNKSNQCPTLTANMGTGGHNVPLVLVDENKKIIRKLTPKECFNFQGYKNFELPKGIADGQLYKQAGNSVTVDLIMRQAELIKKVIGK